MRRRQVILGLGGLLSGATALSACADPSQPSTPRAWKDGRLFIATGNTTGVYYQLGGGYADLITRYVPGYEARAEPTGASAENLQRVASGDMDLALTIADSAADAYTGRGGFSGRPQRIAALAQIYRNYGHLVVRTAAKISKFGDLRGKRISTGSAGSGTEVFAARLLMAGGLDPDRDVARLRASLPDTVRGMQAGTIDALFFAGGLPTPGIADLFTSGPSQYALLPMNELLEPLAAAYGAVYGTASLPKATYSTVADVNTIVVGNLLVVSPDMPDQLAFDLTRILYEYQPELAKVHPEGANFDRTTGGRTDPVPLHPGARRYYDGT